MRLQLPTLLGGLIIACGVQALEFESVIDTDLHGSEIEAHKEAITLAKDIDRGTNDDAIGEASIECPEDNYPKFEVERINVNTFWLTTSVSSADKKYGASILYLIKCSHVRSGGQNN